jgi:hypothetical protein
MTPLPPLLPWPDIQLRLERIFPEGTPQRPWLVRDVCAKTVFTMLYVGAVEGRDVYLAPKHVYRMSDKQALLTTDAERRHYQVDCLKPGYQAVGIPWYADNTREPIRDETLREALAPVGAVAQLAHLATTSNKPRHFLLADFAALFNPSLAGAQLEAEIESWRRHHLTDAARMRTAVVAAAAASESAVPVQLPDGTRRLIEAGPTQQIALKFFEVFIPRFLAKPHVIFLSQSATKQPIADEVFARRIGLNITSRLLPDLVVVDIAEPDALLVFVEFVASDGPINHQRQQALLELAPNLPRHQLAFVTAFVDRSFAPFPAKFPDIAWNSFVWCAAEPEQLIALFGEDSASSLKLSHVIRAMHRQP